MRLILLILALLACKPSTEERDQSSQLQTVEPANYYDDLLAMQTWLEAVSFDVFPVLSAFVIHVQTLKEALDGKHDFTTDQRIQLEKILHKMRSIVAFAIRSGCFVWPDTHQNARA